jgi:hypothetical protein
MHSSRVTRADVPRVTVKASSFGSEVFALWASSHPGPLVQLKKEPAFTEHVSCRMSEHLPHLMENAVQIAWDYLEQTGEIEDAAFASRFLLNSVRQMIEAGERSRLVLSNKAIIAYQKVRQARSAA